ncbi:MAG TPA: hypothetical protein VM182_00150 [Terriglobia bacterium]|nr:hypothetical protein [Terriglobia bacterium]
MKLFLGLGLSVIVLAALVRQSGNPGEAKRFKSPGGRYEVVFEQIEQRKFSEADLQRNVDNVSHIRYKISFYRTGEQTPIRSAEYADVYGWDRDSKPAPLENLFNSILWSPEEDFAVLDEEGWASAPGPPARRAVVLDRDLPWSVVPFSMTDLIWVDALKVIGNSYADCEYSVVEFDGSVGQSRPLHAGKSPLGYEIRSSSGRTVLIGTVLDNCRSEEDMRQFVSECRLLDLASMRERVVPCEPKP